MSASPGTPAGDIQGRRGFQIAVLGALALTRLLALARLIAPDDFGLFAIALTTLALVTALADLAAPARDGRDAARTAELARGLVLALALTLGARPVAALFHEPRAAAVLWALAVVPLIRALGAGWTARPAVAALAEAAAETALAIALARHFGAWALVAGAIGGAVTRAVVSYHSGDAAPYTVAPPSRRTFTFAGWLATAAAIAAATDFILRLAIARRLGAGALGVFALVAGLALLPAAVASELLRGVAAPAYVRLVADSAALRRAVRAAITGLAVTVVPLYAVLAAGAGGIAEDILGPRWVGAAPLLQVLAAAGAVGLVGRAAVMLFEGVAVPRLVVALDLVQLVAVALLARRLTAALGLTGAALALLGAAVVSLVVSRALLRRLLGPAPGHAHRIAAILVSGAVAYVATLLVPVAIGGLPGVVLGMGAGLVAAGAIVRSADRTWRLGIAEDLSAVRVLRSQR